MLMPELHTPDNVKADRGYDERVLKRADGLIAVSENTRTDVIRLLGIDERKVRTIYSGVPDSFFDAEPTPSERPYILCVGTIEPRKNIGTLLDAWEGLPADMRAEFDLCIAGASGWKSEAVMARLNSGIPGVRHLGYVPETGLPGLTAGATAVVYPSLYEGFGFPVAQAMAARVPVITSNVSSLPEVTGNGGITVDPHSVSELRTAIDLMLSSPALRDRLATNARERAEMFRWERCAIESLDFFEQVSGS
jgi:alpha-1,3-rhamnosyl/mannosyltransferase